MQREIAHRLIFAITQPEFHPSLPPYPCPSADGRFAYVVTTDIAGCSTLQAYAVTGAPAPSFAPIGAAIPHQQSIQSIALNPAGTQLVAAAQLAIFNYSRTDGTLTLLGSISGPPYPLGGLYWLLFQSHDPRPGAAVMTSG